MDFKQVFKKLTNQIFLPPSPLVDICQLFFVFFFWRLPLDRFFGISERLKLEGLVVGEQPDYIDEGKTENTLDVNNLTSQMDFLVSKVEDQINEGVRIAEKPVISFHSSHIQSLEELDRKVEESYTKVSPGCWTCNHCDKSFIKGAHAREHVEIHFEGLSFPCSFCDTILRSRKALRQHKKIHFSWCFRAHYSLRKHILLKHNF